MPDVERAPPRPSKRRRLPRAGRALALWGGLIALVLTLAFSARLGEEPASGRFGGQIFDLWQRLMPRAPNPDPAVALVDIDERSLQMLGQWPWPRDLMAEMITRLGEAGAAAIAFDMTFAEPDRTSLGPLAERLEARGITLDLPEDPALRDNDLAFARAIGAQPVVLGIAISHETGAALPAPKAGFAHAGTDPRHYLPDGGGGLGNLAVLNAPARGIGSFSFPPARDNILRALPLVAQSRGALWPGLGIEALRVAQGASGLVLRSSDAATAAAGAGPIGLSALRVGALEIPSDPQGWLAIHYSGMPAMPVLSAATLLSDSPLPEALRAQIEGRMILVGTSAIGLRDLVSTPREGLIPGVVAHAELIDQAVIGHFLTRPDWARGAELVAAAILGLLLLAGIQSGRPGLAAGVFLLSAGAALAGSALAFGQGLLLLDPLPALIALLAVFLSALPLQLWLGNRDRRFVRRAFGHYLSPTLVARLSDDPGALQLGGETRDITLLFSDIRGFSTLSEGLAPEELTRLLNDVLTPLTDVLLRHDATIDKYIGDAIMALWNAPLDIPDHPIEAARAALAMLEAMAALRASSGQQISIGIGLHRGPACVGNLGSAQRFSYSAIGDSVNLAARIEGLTSQYKVPLLISSTVQAALPDFAWLIADHVRVIGRATPERIYLLWGDETCAATPEFRAWRAAHDDFFAAWTRGDFAHAGPALEAACARAPEELAAFYQVWKQRLAEITALPHWPTGQEWDPIHTARQK